jgi:hypothetical protein
VWISYEFPKGAVTKLPWAPSNVLKYFFVGQAWRSIKHNKGSRGRGAQAGIRTALKRSLISLWFCWFVVLLLLLVLYFASLVTWVWLLCLTIWWLALVFWEGWYSMKLCSKKGDVDLNRSFFSLYFPCVYQKISMSNCMHAKDWNPYQVSYAKRFQWLPPIHFNKMHQLFLYRHNFNGTFVKQSRWFCATTYDIKLT